MYARLLAFLFAFPCSSDAHLKEGVRCVQNQLTEAGYDLGASDGEVGPKTRRALAKIQLETGLVLERTFDVTLGNSVCRRLGLIQTDLQQFWPSMENGQPEVVFSDAIRPRFKGRVLTSIKRAHAGMKQTFRVDLAGRDVILVADNQKDLKRLISKHAQVPLAGLSSGVAEACASSRGVSGRVYPGLFYMCVADDAALVAEIDQAWMDFFVGHEMVHLMQFQLGGAVLSERGVKKQLLHEGPVWLGEGSAQAYGNQFALQTPDWDYRIVNYRRLKNTFPDLAALEKRDALASRKLDVYRAGTVGAIDLIDLYGYPAIGQFYDYLGHGVGWTEAFEVAFGLPPETFYKHYRGVNRFDLNGDPIQGPLVDLTE